MFRTADTRMVFGSRMASTKTFQMLIHILSIYPEFYLLKESISAFFTSIHSNELRARNTSLSNVDFGCHTTAKYRENIVFSAFRLNLKLNMKTPLQKSWKASKFRGLKVSFSFFDGTIRFRWNLSVRNLGAILHMKQNIEL